MKKYYTILFGAFACAAFCDSSLLAETITVRQVVNSDETKTINGDTYSAISNPSENGGAIYNAGTLTINNATFTENFGKNGGAIYNAGTTTINGATFADNAAWISGGAIYSTGVLTINSTATAAVSFADNGMSGGMANDLYLAGQNANNRAVLNLNAYDSDAHDIQFGGNIAGNFYDVNVNANGTGLVTVAGLTGASNLTLGAGTFTSAGAVSVGSLNVTGDEAQLVVNDSLTVLGGANSGTISGTGAFNIGDGVTTVVYNNAGFIIKPVSIKEHATLATAAHLFGTNIENNGVLQLNDTVLGRAVTGTGITRINGTVSSTASIENAIDILSGKSLTVSGANLLGGTVTNAGTLSIGSGNLTNNIAGITGQTYIDGAVVATSSTSIQNSITINSGKSLQINAYGLHGVVNNLGTLLLGDGTLVKKVTGTGETHIAGLVSLSSSIESPIVIDDTNSLTANADNIGNTVANDAGTLFLSGGDLGYSVSGNGETRVAGIVSVLDGVTIANGVIIEGANRLTANADAFGANISNQNGLLKLTGGVLNADITGAGNTRVIADTTINANVANNLYLDGTSAVTFETNAAIADGAKVIANGGSLSFLNGAVDSFELQKINLQSDMNLALDLDLANMTADVFNANYDTQSADGKWVIISKLNLINNVATTIDDNTNIHILNGTIGANVKLADDIEFINPGDISSVLLSYNYDAASGGDINLSYATIPDAITSTVAANKSIVLGENVNVDSGTGGLAMVGDSVTISGANKSINGTGQGISVATGQSLTVSNVSAIAGFTNAIVNNGGTVSLTAVNFAGANVVDVVNNAGTLNLNNVFINSVANDAAMNVAGNLNLAGDVSGSGSLFVDAGSVINLGNNVITQSAITVDGRVITSAQNLGRLIANTIDGAGVLELLDVRSAGLYNVFQGTSTLLVDAGAFFDTTNTAGGVLVSVKPVEEIVAAYHVSNDAAYMIANLATTSAEDLVNIGVLMRDEVIAGNMDAVESATGSLNPETGAVVQSVSTVLRDNVAALANSRMVTNSSKTAKTKSVGVWGQGIYTKEKQNDFFNGYTRGIAGGADMTLRGNKMVGFGYAFAHSDILTSSRDIDVDSSTVFLYGQYQLANWYTNAMLNYTVSDFTENANALGIKVGSNYDTKSYGAQVMTGYDFADGMTPEFGLQYMHIDVDAYTNALGIKNGINSSDYLTLVLGTKYTREFNVGRGVTLQPYGHYAVKYDAVSDKSSVTVSMPGINPYALDIEGLSRVAGEFGIGIGAKYRSIDASLTYDIEVRDGYTAQYGRAKFRYSF